MNNPRVTPKERNLLKGAIRRVFARSDLHQQAMDKAKIDHTDPKKPRCKKWIKCAICLQPSPAWSSAVDHTDPVVPIDRSLLDMSFDELIDRLWCDLSNLSVLCEPCHTIKTRQERIAREDIQIAKGLRKPRKVKKPKKITTKAST